MSQALGSREVSLLSENARKVLVYVLLPGVILDVALSPPFLVPGPGIDV